MDGADPASGQGLDWMRPLQVPPSLHHQPGSPCPLDAWLQRAQRARRTEVEDPPPPFPSPVPTFLLGAKIPWTRALSTPALFCRVGSSQPRAEPLRARRGRGQRSWLGGPERCRRGKAKAPRGPSRYSAAPGGEEKTLLCWKPGGRRQPGPGSVRVRVLQGVTRCLDAGGGERMHVPHAGVPRVSVSVCACTCP